MHMGFASRNDLIYLTWKYTVLQPQSWVDFNALTDDVDAMLGVELWVTVYRLQDSIQLYPHPSCPCPCLNK